MLIFNIKEKKKGRERTPSHGEVGKKFFSTRCNFRSGWYGTIHFSLLGKRVIL